MPTPSVSETVRTANADLLASLPFDDTSDFEDAQRGFIGRLDPVRRHGPPTGASSGTTSPIEPSWRDPPRTASTPASGASPS